MTYRSGAIDPVLRGMLAERGLMDYIDGVMATSLLSDARLMGMMRAIDASNEVDGETVEIGCAAGGTSRLIAMLNRGRRHWACDTFVGLVDVGDNDPDLKNGHFRKRTSTLEAVSGRLSDLPNVVICGGYLPEAAPKEMRDAVFALAHLDVDTYQSTVNCFRFVAPRMNAGSTIVLDDVAGRGTAGGKLAWQEINSDGVHWDVVEENNQQVVIRLR